MMANQRGFTLIEILVSLAIFAVVVIGALGVLGAAGSGGFLSGFTTGFVTTRAARDITAASVYLQAFQEHAASQAASQGDASINPGVYCDGTGCGSPNLSSAGLGAYPLPSCNVTAACPQPYQLDRWKLDVTIQRWYACFNTSVSPPTFVKYSTDPGSGCTVDITKEYLVRAHSTLTWQYRGVTRTLDVDRYLP